MNHKPALTVTCLCALLLCPGCSSMELRQTPSVRDEKKWSIYPGVRMDADFLRMTFAPHGEGERIASRTVGLLFPVFVIDLPFSLVLDTILLPYDLARTAGERQRTQRTNDTDGCPRAGSSCAPSAAADSDGSETVPLEPEP